MDDFGVNGGEVVAGAGRVGEPIVTGDAVKVAAGLEQAATPGEILIGESTVRLGGALLRVEALAPIAAKGKSEPVAAYRLLGVEPGLSRPARRSESPLVGRDAELTALRAAFAEAVSHACTRLVLVLGEPGVG